MTPDPEPSDPTEEADPAPAPRPESAPRRALLDFMRDRWQLASAIGLLVIGIVFVVLGWYGAAHTNVATEQVPYLISGGLLGLGLIIVSGFLASGAGAERRNEEFRRTLTSILRESRGIAVPADAIVAAPSNGRVFAVPGGQSYHIAGCPIVEGKEGVRVLDPGAAVAAGLAPCKLCGPD